MDAFLSKKNCDRCGCDLRGKGRIMSMFNTDCLCPDCKEKETALPEYREAGEAERKHVLAGNMNFPGIGYPKK